MRYRVIGYCDENGYKLEHIYLCCSKTYHGSEIADHLIEFHKIPARRVARKLEALEPISVILEADL